MLKHATPRYSPGQKSRNVSPQKRTSLPHDNSFSVSLDNKECEPINKDWNGQLDLSRTTIPVTYNERSVDCGDIVVPISLNKKEQISVNSLQNGSLWIERIFNFNGLSVSSVGITPVITQGKAIIRRGLSFSAKKNGTISVDTVNEDSLNECDKVEDSKNVLFLKNLTSTENQMHISSPDTDPIECPLSESSKSESFKRNRTRSYKVFRICKNDHPTLKTLLRLPGIYGHIPVPESTPRDTPHLLSPDCVSLNSSDSFLSSNSGRVSSRSWGSNESSNSNQTSDSFTSNASSTSESTTTTLKVFARCLRSDIEYKTVNVGSQVTSRQLINQLLTKARMKHRDPNLFYLTMEVTVRRWSGMPVRALLVLEDDARPSQLALCHPTADLKFVLQMKKGGVIKIHDTILMPSSQYKSLFVSYRTTCAEVVQLLLNCYNKKENKNDYSLHEVCLNPQYSDRVLDPSEKPLELKSDWPRDRSLEFTFVLRRNMTQALSLRKLSQRNEDNKCKGRIEPQIKEQLIPLKLDSNFKKSFIKEIGNSTHETVIDCTTKTPTMTKMLQQSLSKREIPQNSQIGSNEFVVSYIKKPLDIHSFQKLNKSIPKEKSPQTSAETHLARNVFLESKNGEETIKASLGQVMNNENEIKVNPKSISKSVDSPDESDNLILHSIKQPNISREIDNHTLGRNEKINKDHYSNHDERLNEQNLSLSLVQHTEKPRCAVTKKLTTTQQNSSQRKGGNPLTVCPETIFQTKVTCISLKGINKHRRWNSVEALVCTPESLPSNSTDEIQNKDYNTSNSTRNQSNKNQMIHHQFNENHQSKIFSFHKDNNKQCKCSECFYI